MDLVSLIGSVHESMLLLAVHVDDVAGNTHVGGIVGVVNHDVQEIEPERAAGNRRVIRVMGTRGIRRVLSHEEEVPLGGVQERGRRTPYACSPL